MNDTEQLLLYDAFPVQCIVNVLNVPLIKFNMYFEYEQIAEGTFKTNPAHPLVVQTKHAVLATEQIMKKIFSAEDWQKIFILYAALPDVEKTNQNNPIVEEYTREKSKLNDDIERFLDDAEDQN
jgi:hypothetical protein